MAGDTRIIAFDPSGEEAAGAELLLEHEAEQIDARIEEEAGEENTPSFPRLDWLAPLLAGSAVLGWTLLFTWANIRQFSAAGDINAWTDLIADWSVPVLLICTIWLLFMRNSRREAVRFGDAASLLSSESARLEARLITVNRELSLAREFIASQSRDLEALGRLATERLSQNAERLQDLIRDNGARLDTIGTVSETALDNMEKLRGQLPVIASSAKDITNNIANAGRTAHAQLSDLVSGFNRLNEFGQASERQVQLLRSEVDKAIAEFVRQSEQLGEIASNRFAALAQSGAEFRTQLESNEVEALAAIRSRATALAEEFEHTRQQLDSNEAESLTSLRARLAALRDEGVSLSRSLRDGEARALESWQETMRSMKEEMASAIASFEAADSGAIESARARLAALAEEVEALETRVAERNRVFEEEITRRQAAVEANDEQIVSRLSERLAALDEEIVKRRAAHEEQSTAIAAHSETIAARLGECEHRLNEIAALSCQNESSIAASLRALSDRLVEARATLANADGEMASLTDSSVRLLELIQASTHLSGNELRQALSGNDESLTAFENRVARLHEIVAETDRQSGKLSELVEASGSSLKDVYADFEERQSRLDERGADYETALSRLRETLETIEEQNDRLAEKAQGELSDAIERLKTAAEEAVAAIGDQGAAAVSALASKLGAESAEAIDKAMHATAAETAGRLEQAAAHAAGVGREVTVQLRDQLVKVDELVGNLERRVVHARQRAEEQVDNDFSRRAALITEALNSNAIDIARAMSSEVSDTAWAAYLRGDRGIFTRRAVNLLESGEAKAITQLFERDSDFREHVSRYIHDFEAILRQVLSTRDGHALGVTLLSSDMGKLYVSLAQAIERLRS